MAHIHLPDGAFSIQWIITWWILAVIILGLCLYWLKKVKKIDNKTITLAAMLTAASFAIFQVNIPLFGGVHMTLTPLTGILAGPVIGSIIVLIVNILSAAIGHGGWGMIGANLLVNITEVTVAYGIYKALSKINLDTFSKAGIGTIIGLLFGNIAMLLIILISGIQGVNQDIQPLLYGLSLIAAVNMGVAIIESFITGYVVSYIKRVRPDILAEESHAGAK
ncbi:MAG: energy-coupling factor ABC transporter permease [Candidatus Methanoperedens sp.]|nr:energy-coupling factor ABC transporter permease [Candidatus Methanoperedens sp.]MCE8425294.1 energy-coupling factor ABC transporter permease [Candidatus Methanoperedens sp.]MCE8427815.1 energy-coupling factor ABC transporter permease [Candidatus Methanoperedens sp.]